MKSEVLFRYYASWRGRYTSSEGFEITIRSDFSNPAVWPYQVEKYTWEESMFDDPKQEETRSAKLPLPVFNRIKQLIAATPALAECEKDWDGSYSSSGQYDRVFFGCDAFQTTVQGSCLMDDGRYGTEEGETNDAVLVYRMANEVMQLAKEAGIDFLPL